MCFCGPPVQLNSTPVFHFFHPSDVYLAREKGTGAKVALKQIKMHNETEGFPITSIREIKFLTSLDHVNIVKLKEVIQSRRTYPYL